MRIEKILRYLDNGFFMTRQEQAEAAAYIRELQQAVLDEREACAKLCEDLSVDYATAERCADSIRARGNHG